MSEPEHISKIIPRTEAYKRLTESQDAQSNHFDLKTAQKSLDEFTEPYNHGLTLLQIQVIADHFKIEVKEIEKLLF
jgi:hypothetical protein